MANSVLKQQVEAILDRTTDREVDVIVQMAATSTRPKQLMRIAGEALCRRRLTLTPRDLLPEPYSRKLPSRKVRQQTASSRVVLGKLAKASIRTLALAASREIGLGPLAPLIASSIVGQSLGRAKGKKGRGVKGRRQPQRFWTSRAMPLRLSRDELAQLPDEVKNIKSIYINRPLTRPSIVETQMLPLEDEEILGSTWGLEKIKAPSVWGTHGIRGEGIKVGLLDTGVDPTHPDLQGKISAWAEFDSMGAEVPGSQAYDSDEHGTHCAGTIVGGSTSGRHIGVAPGAQLAVALVLDGQVGGTDAQVLAGIDWAVEQGVDVISLSLGGLVMDAETPPTYTEAILTCLESGIPVVAAIGNEGGQTSGSPGNDLFALSIGATDYRDRVAGFSGGRTQIIYASDFIDERYLPLPYIKPDLAAPGVAVRSSVPGGDWKSFSGTSMATPHVAGAVALLLSATSIRDKEDGMARSSLIQDLITGAVEDLGEAGQDQRYGFGRLEVLRAIDIAHAKGYQ